MCSLKSIMVCCLLMSVVMISGKKSNEPDSIGFPEIEENPQNANKDNRQPLFIPATCPEGELYYPGDQKDDWICDCLPSHLYHPSTNRCWPAYRRGPCENGSYLILGEESAIPFCEKNLCHYDGFVLYNGKCELLGLTGPCKNVYPDIEMLTVNSTTLTVGCERIRVDSRFQEQDIKVLPLPCPAGGKRSINGKCSSKTGTTP